MKVLAEQKAAAEVAVVVTKCTSFERLTNAKLFLLLAFFISGLHAAVLPEDRSDAMYHSYEGGGMKIDGPSILIRKSLFDKVSVSANYYIDNVSAASIDVLANASPYTEKRTEYSLGADYLINKTTLSTSYTNSTENDYEANTAYFGVSQDFFGDLSTLSIGYSKGWDLVGNSTDASFEEEANRQNYKINWTQIVTKNMIMSAGLETVTDQGYLNNPYRVVRFWRVENGVQTIGKKTEVYPETRTSTAFSLSAKYYLPYRAAIKLEGRTFSDTWDIKATNYEVAYIHPLNDHWHFEGKVRTYKQSQARFYNDLFESENFQNFMARDKEMSDHSNISYGVGAVYQHELADGGFFKKFTVNLYVDYFQFDYNNFRNELASRDDPGLLGNEPLYSFDATVTRFFFSVWY